MAIVVKDRVKVTFTTTGTADFTLGTASLGFQDFAIIGNGNETYYAAVDAITGDWEVGIGTYTTAGPTLTRTTILESSAAGAKVSFGSGSKEVFVTYPAERAVYLDTAGSYPVQSTFNGLSAALATLTAGTVATTPLAGTDIANKSYVDTVAAAGIHYHTPVFVESPNTAGNLNALYNQPGGAGVGVGATLTNNGTKAALMIDGVLMTTTKRVLIYNQTNAFENGVYTVTTVGTPDPGGTNWVLTRATDADTYAPSSPNSLGQGDAFFVTSGDTGAGEGYVCTTVGTITFGTTAITFSQFSASVAYSAGTGLNLNPATTFNISNVGTAGTYGSASNVPVLTTNAQGQVTGVTNTGIAITSAAVSGLAASATTDTTNADNITSGTLPSGRITGSYTGLTGTGALAAGSLATGFTAVSAPLGGTGQTSYAVGDLLYASTSTALSKLADVAVGNALISGGVGSAPNYGKIGLATHVDGTLPVANGGTGVTSSTGTGSVVLSDSPTLVTPVITANSTTDALRITQLGTGNALVVEDSANPDASPFVIDASGRAISGYTSAITTGSFTAPVQLHANNSSSANAGYSAFNWSSNAAGAAYSFFKSRGGTIGTPSIVNSADTVGFTQYFAYDGASWLSCASIQAAIDGTPGTNDMPGRLVFSTTADGASTATERMRIDSAGNVGIGTSSPSTKLDVVTASGNSQLRVSNGTYYGYFGIDSGYAGLDYAAPSGGHRFRIGGSFTTAMTLDSSGNLGIGNTSPAQKLDVTGNIKFSGALYENVFTITDGASVDLNPANGTIQLWTLGASRSPTATNFAAGQSMTLMVNDGTAYTITWPSVTWVGGAAPTLATTGYTVIELWEVGSTLYGAAVGNA